MGRVSPARFSFRRVTFTVDTRRRDRDDHRVRYPLLLLLSLLAGCDDKECGGTWLSDIEHQPGAVVASETLFGLTWTRRDVGARGEPVQLRITDAATRPDFVHALALPDGSVVSTFEDPTMLRAVAGKTTVLWRKHPFELTLQGRDGTQRVSSIPSDPWGEAALVFDGERYHAFWEPEAFVLHHRWIAEDGSPGPLTVLDWSMRRGTSIRGVSDGNGRLLLQLGVDAYIVDVSAGTMRRVFEGDPDGASGSVPRYESVFWFAGEFHIRDSGRLFSIDANDNVRTRFLHGDLMAADDIIAGTSSLFITTPSHIVEVDADLRTLRYHEPPPVRAAVHLLTAFGNDLVRFDRRDLDVSSRTPGFIELRRGDVWTREIATDSPIRFVPYLCR